MSEKSRDKIIEAGKQAWDFDGMQSQSITVEIDCITAISIIGQLQLASRHPANNGLSQKEAEKFARLMQAAIAAKFPAMTELMELGWNPDYDI